MSPEGHARQRSNSLSLSRAPTYWHSCLCSHPHLRAPGLPTGPRTCAIISLQDAASRTAVVPSIPMGEAGAVGTPRKDQVRRTITRPTADVAPWELAETSGPVRGGQCGTAPALVHSCARCWAHPLHPTHSTCWRLSGWPGWRGKATTPAWYVHTWPQQAPGTAGWRTQLCKEGQELQAAAW